MASSQEAKPKSEQSRQPREITDEKAKQLVKDEVEKARKLLKRVTDPKDEKFAKEGKPALTGDDLIASPGLAFQFLKKVGAGVGVLQGHGFVIKKLDTKPGRAADASGIAWSAPVFYSVTGLSVGLQVGWAEVHTLLIPEDEQSLKHFLERSAKFGADAGIKIGKKGGGSSTKTGAPLVFSVEASGAIVNLSVNGATVSRDDDLIQKVYGKVEHPEDILQGRIPPPSEAKPLYDDLKQVVEDYHRYVSSQSSVPDVPIVLAYEEIVDIIAEDDIVNEPTYDDITFPAIDPLDDFPDVDLDTPIGFDLSTLDALPLALTAF